MPGFDPNRVTTLTFDCYGNRPQFAAALTLCRQHKARLVIAKLARLARSV